MVEVGKSISKTIKQNTKKALIVFSLPFLINNFVSGGYLSTRCNSSFNKPSIGISHKTGVREPGGYDEKDVEFLPVSWNPAIDFYSRIDFGPYRLARDFRPAESMTTITSEILGRGLGAATDAQLQFSFYDIGEDNFSWKNIIGELSQRVDDGEGGYKYALIGNYDIKNMVSSARTIPISINNGITQGDKFFPSHKLDYKFFNHADFNRDRKVNGLDFAIWTRNFGRSEESDPNTLGSNVGKDPNDLDAYTDIDRNGIVDYNDLSLFSGEWLWDANDPNTWSRVR